MNYSINNYLHYDVVVVGGGPAGCAAAVASARRNCKTLLIESTSSLGGMSTVGLVPSWCPFSDKEKIIYRSIAEEIFTAAKIQMKLSKPDELDWVPISAEDLKLVYDRIVSEAGVEVLFRTSLCDVITEGRDITNIIISNKQGITAVKADVYVDCTGDADVAYFAGLPFQKGNQYSELQPASLCFVITNVNTDRMFDVHLHGGVDSIWEKISEDPKYDLICNHFVPSIIGKGTVGINAGHLFDSDGTDMKQITKSMMQGRRAAKQYHDAMKEYIPQAFGESYLVSTASVLGTRESRRIEGEYTLNVDDYIARRTFPDEISRNCYYLDVHPSRQEIENNQDDLRDFTHYKKGESHGIPWRCLVPKDLNNLLVGGRIISVERDVMGSTRVLPNCLTTGEAAGIGASIASIKGIKANAVDAQEVRNELKKCGAYIK